MKNFGYLTSAIRRFFKMKVSDSENVSFGRLLMGLLTSFIGLLLFIYILQKVYEVPVYTTTINIVSPGYLPDSSGINICILRNYDRPIKPTFPADSVIKEHVFFDKFDGGVFISFTCLADSFDRQTVSFRFTGKHEYICRCDSNGMIFPRNVLDSVFSDSLFEKYNVEKSIKPIYTSIETSDRQLFYLSLTSTPREHPYSVDSILYECNYDGKKFNSRWYDMHSYFRLWKAHKKDKHKNISEQWTIVSSIDTIIPIFHVFKPLSYSKPNVLLTAEDVSRLVEIIELNDICPNSVGNISEIRSLTIGYQTHTDFPEEISPAPDEKTLSYIRYTDKKKIKEIGVNGLRFYVKFPMMESIQDARIFILSAITTGLGGFFFTYFFKILTFGWIETKKLRRKYKTQLVMVIIILLILLLMIVYKLMFQFTNVKPF